jgi:hypothetical protein
MKSGPLPTFIEVPLSMEQFRERPMTLETKTIDAKQLLKMSQQQLDALFGAHEAGPIPDGEAKGTAIIAPGTSDSESIAELINIFAWQGKVFDAKAGVLQNHILPLGLKAIIARVYKGPSLLDGKECIILDYSETSLVASHVRDEIRQIEPGFYLGKVYCDQARLIDFSLDFRS